MGQFAAISDQFSTVPRKPATFCEFLAPTGISTRSFAACSDGRIRVLNYFPNKIVAEIGSHSKGYPIEAMALSNDCSLIATAAHDQKVRFWNIEQYQYNNKVSNETFSSDSEDSEMDDIDTTENEKIINDDNMTDDSKQEISKQEEEEEEEKEQNIKPIFKKTRKGFFSGF